MYSDIHRYAITAIEIFNTIGMCICASLASLRSWYVLSFMFYSIPVYTDDSYAACYYRFVTSITTATIAIVYIVMHWMSCSALKQNKHNNIHSLSVNRYYRLIHHISWMIQCMAKAADMAQRKRATEFCICICEMLPISI